MGDQFSDGYRSACREEARQEMIENTIDGFFRMVLARLTGIETDAQDFRKAFDTFDGLRYSSNIASHRIAKERGRRWEAFRSLLDDASGKRRGRRVMKGWAEILSLAMRFASRDVARMLHQASVFGGYHVALYVPNGTGYNGHVPPALYGDLVAALDAVATDPLSRRGLYAQIIEDPDRAVVSIIAGGGRSEERRDEKRAKLRFFAAKKAR